MELSSELVDLIADELNIQTVEFRHDAKEYLNYELKPQLKVLGPKYGSKLGAIRNYLNTCDAVQVVDTVNAGGTVKFDADGTEIELSKEDLLISPISKEGFTSEGDGTYTVVLSTEITPELAEIGLVREFVSKVQQTRKDSGFEVVDHIEISYTADAETSSVLEKYSKDVMADTLADKMVCSEVSDMTEVDVNGKVVKLALKKV